MKSLEEINIIKNYIIETTKFENINMFMGYGTERQVETYAEQFGLNIEEIKDVIVGYYVDLQTANLEGYKAVQLGERQLQMLLPSEEVDEYCSLCKHSNQYFFNQDVVELEEGLIVANIYEHLYRKAVDDNKYHYVHSMTYIPEDEEYVFDEEYLKEHYRQAFDDMEYHRIENLTEVSHFPPYNWEVDMDRNYTEYIFSNDYLLDNYAIAYDDNKYHLINNMIWIECEERYIFDRTYLSSHYGHCQECDEYFPRENGEWLNNYDMWVCDDCIDKHYSITCEICHERIRDGEEEYITNDYGNEIAVCRDCYENDAAYRIDDDVDSREYIRPYHDNRGAWTEYRCEDEDETVTLYGTELEVEPKRCARYHLGNAANAAMNNLNCILTSDGSLNTNGFEIVSQPQSYKYIMEHKENYEKAFQEIIDNGYISHNSNHCGLHFHVTAPPQEQREEVVGRLWLIIETFKEQFQALSRRRGNFQWCHFLSERKKTEDSVYKLAKVAKERNDEIRYLVINDRNPKTIEIRLFRGTLNVNTFFADLQLVHNLFNVAYNLELPITDVTFDMLTEGDIISEYCRENNIHSDKRITDDSAKYILMEKKIVNLTKNILDIIWREIEDMKKTHNEQLNKKTANSQDNGYDYLVKVKEVENKMSSALEVYMQTRTSYDKKNIKSIIYNLSDVRYYMKNETINKKIDKIQMYYDQIVA